MSHAFCTLFDKNYLFKGLALHESLRRCMPDFTLWILCMDEVAYDTLAQLGLPNARLISLSDFEDAELRDVKPTRTPVEYCWTCTPSLPLYLLETVPGLDMITYLDADLFFFSDPDPVFNELGDGSIGIVGHRYSRRWEHLTNDSGIYNVEFMVFRNDARGKACLRWWRDRCLEWCYHRVEDGKMGDQKYLDDWPERFEGVVVLQHKGAGLAPWNIDRYRVTKRGDAIYVDDQALVFYHFHSLSILNEGRDIAVSYPEYGVSGGNAKLVYGPYFDAVREAIRRTRTVDPGYAFGIEESSADSLAEWQRVNRRARLSRIVNGSPLLRRAWSVARPLIRPAPRSVVPTENQKDSWKADDVARQQQELVLKELKDPESVPPFRTFLQIMSYVVDHYEGCARAFLDVGCGVGHYSELLRERFPMGFSYTGSDYSEAMIARARSLWPDAEFVLDDVFDSNLDFRLYDVVMASALVDVLEDYWTVLDLLFSRTERLLILHRQRFTEGPSYSEPTSGYEGQVTYATYLNLVELEDRLGRHGLTIVKVFTVVDEIRSLLIERVRPRAADALAGDRKHRGSTESRFEGDG